LDIGIHPGINGLNGLPFMDFTDPAKIDILLISHFHLDHCGGLPWFLQKTGFKGQVFMTHATKAIYRWLLSDYIKVSTMSDEMLFTEAGTVSYVIYMYDIYYNLKIWNKQWNELLK